MKRRARTDYILTGFVFLIGYAEIAHLAGVFLQWPFGQCSALFGILVAVSALLCVAAGIVSACRKRLGQSNLQESEAAPVEGAERRRTLLLRENISASYVVFGIVVILQLVFIGMGMAVYRRGDMTVETVGSFLANDGIYKVNPLTGREYSLGIPLRLEILCLPTLYGAFCSLLKADAVFLIRIIVPMVVLLLSYAAFWTLSGCLLEHSKLRGIFMLFVSLSFWAGAYMFGMDGFNVLCSGWRGVTIRNLILLPWLLSLCMRKKWLGIIICILAEACIVWTLYGMGISLLMTVGMLLAGLYEKGSEKRESVSRGKEEGTK